MRRVRLLVALAMMGLLVVGACSNPTGPKYPQEKTEPGEPPPPDAQGFHLEVYTGTFFV